MKNLANKLIQVMSECSDIRKNGTNDFHKYKYVTSSDVLERVNTSLVKHKIASVVMPEVVDTAEVITAKGNTEHLVTVKVNITLIDAESDEKLYLSGLGSGQDSGDKAAMKAQTAAIKYAYLLSLAISTNDDPEADSRTDENTNSPVSQSRVNPDKSMVCHDCNAKITRGILTVSQTKHGRPLCMKCQKKEMEAA
jgi:ERF superfamily.